MSSTSSDSRRPARFGLRPFGAHARVRACLLGVASVAATSACDAPSRDAAPLGNSPSALVPLGPTPGPRSSAPPPESPVSGDETALNAGRIYFLRYNCAGCHGDHGGGGMGPSLRDQEWIYGSDEDDIFDSIAEGRAHGMPAWGTKVPDDIIWKLVAYVRSLRTGEEPEPPDQTIPLPPEISP
jgi:cytochrome c oxidase cbb3-type subunit 3